MRRAGTIGLLVFVSSAWADPPLTAQQHLFRGARWKEATQYERAIEEFEQAYLLDGKPSYLSLMAESYDQRAGMATKTQSEVMESKQRALELYKVFMEKAPPEEPGLDKARARTESLPQEIKALEAQRDEQEASAKLLLETMKQLLTEIRALQEQLPRRERGASAGFMR